MNQQLAIIVILTKYSMYTTALCTWSLRFVFPNPDEYKGIFGVAMPPHYYLVFYNLLRWFSGNKSWIVGGGSCKTTASETVTTPEGTVQTNVSQEVTPSREARAAVATAPAKEEP